MKKVYCKDCKFNKCWADHCKPFLRVRTRIPDYYSPNHLIKKMEWELELKAKRNKGNDCNTYIHKWWKFWVK